MKKKYIVRLPEEERAICDAIKKEKGKSEKLRRATILLKADADGPAWGDAKSARQSGVGGRRSRMCGRRSSLKASRRR